MARHTPSHSHLQRNGLVIALLSAAAFASSGAFAKSLLLQGWSPGTVVTARVFVAALVLLVPTIVVLRGRWAAVWRHRLLILGYGAVAVAGTQLAYFNAVSHLSVAVALLIEYLAPVLLVVVMWVRTRVAPGRLTLIGSMLSVAGLVLVIDLTGAVEVSVPGVLWGLLAACGVACYFVLSAHPTGLPSVALAGGGLLVGAVLLGLAGLLRLLPMEVGAQTVTIARWRVSWVVPILEISVIAAAFAYATGVVGARMLGAKLASFVGLTEVLFAVVIAWALLGELPRLIQLGGGILIVVGVVVVRWDEFAGLTAAEAGPSADRSVRHTAI